MIDLTTLTIKTAHEGLLQKAFSSHELVQSALDNIETNDATINAFLTVTADQALQQAKKIDEKIARKEQISILAGIPYSTKDVFSTRGIQTTASSNILKSYKPPYSATTIKKMEQEDAILIGKTNNDAFGFGSSTENSDFQVTKNPWDSTKVAGGSSGGSAAAVATGMGLFSLGEDTGGSIRQPASFCGISGIKVTYGRVSRFGVLAYGSSLDTIGPMARTVEDLAYILTFLAGKDPRDATTLPAPVPNYPSLLETDLQKLTIGIPQEYFIEGMDKEVEAAVKKAIAELEKAGAKVESVSLPNTKYAVSAYYLAGMSEVSANLARYDGIRFGLSDRNGGTIEDIYTDTRAQGFGPEVKRRIMLGTYALSSGYYDAYYKKAQQIRTLIRRDFDEVFKKVQILIAPVSPFPAFGIGEKANDPLQMWLADVFTVTINPAGVPSLAIPCGFSAKGLPIGMQIIGPQLSEEKLFAIGHQYQQLTDWHTKIPPIIKY